MVGIAHPTLLHQCALSALRNKKPPERAAAVGIEPMREA
jgi:hypothetical protein